MMIGGEKGGWGFYINGVFYFNNFGVFILGEVYWDRFIFEIDF